MGCELVVVVDAPSHESVEWLRTLSDVVVIELPEHLGVVAARNAAIAAYPEAEAVVFFDDDVWLRGGETGQLLADLQLDKRAGVAGGFPVDTEGTPLTTRFHRRPGGSALARLWDRWWGIPVEEGASPLQRVDALPASAMAIRGAALRRIGGFEPLFSPAGFEDLDLCARALFAGYTVILNERIPIHQEISATTGRVFGLAYANMLRSSAILFAMIDYPASVAVARVLLAAIRGLFGPLSSEWQGEAAGVLRCARQWRSILDARGRRRNLRKLRARFAGS